MEEYILVGLSSAPSNARIIRTAAAMAVKANRGAQELTLKEIYLL